MPVLRAHCSPAALMLFGAGLIATPVLAGNSTTPGVTNAPPFVTRVINEDVKGMPPVARAYLAAGTNRFAFLIPQGFRLDASSRDKLLVAALNKSCFISIRRVHGLNSSADSSPAPSDCRTFLKQEYPSLKFRDEFSRAAAGRTGPAFDFEWNISGGAVQSARAVFIPTDIGILEFKLVTNPGNFRAATYKLNNVLLSFTASKDGKLEVVSLSNKL